MREAREQSCGVIVGTFTVPAHSIIACSVTNYLQMWQFKTANIYELWQHQFLWVRNLGMAQLGGSGSEFVWGLSRAVWPELWSSRGLAGVGGTTSKAILWLLAGGFSAWPWGPPCTAPPSIAAGSLEYVTQGQEPAPTGKPLCLLWPDFFKLCIYLY